MTIVDEIKSGKFGIYGQWLALISAVTFIFTGFFNLFGMLILFAIFGWVFTFIILIIEVAFFQKCCPTSDNFNNFISKFENNFYRSGLYTAMAIIMWFSTSVEGSTIVVGAIFMTLSAACYGKFREKIHYIFNFN